MAANGTVSMVGVRWFLLRRPPPPVTAPVPRFAQVAGALCHVQAPDAGGHVSRPGGPVTALPIQHT